MFQPGSEGGQPVHGGLVLLGRGLGGDLDVVRAYQRHPLFLPAGRFGGVAVGEPVEVNQFQEFGDALADVVAGSAADFRPKATLSQTVM